MSQFALAAHVAPLFAADVDGLDEFGSLSTRTHVLMLAATAVGVFAILRLVRRHGLRSKYSLLWLTLAVVLAAVGVFPGLLVAVSRLVGIHYPPAAFLALAVAALLVIVIHFSWELSRLEERTRLLSEHSALLGAEVDRLRAQIDDLASTEDTSATGDGT